MKSSAVEVVVRVTLRSDGRLHVPTLELHDFACARPAGPCTCTPRWQTLYHLASRNRGVARRAASALATYMGVEYA